MAYPGCHSARLSDYEKPGKDKIEKDQSVPEQVVSSDQGVCTEAVQHGTNGLKWLNIKWLNFGKYDSSDLKS